MCSLLFLCFSLFFCFGFCFFFCFSLCFFFCFSLCFFFALAFAFKDKNPLVGAFLYACALI